MIEAYDLCQRNHAEFEDYVDRALCMNRAAAKHIMKVYAMDVDPALGFDNMKIVASIQDNKIRKDAEESFKNGSTPTEVKHQIKAAKPEPGLTVNKLKTEKTRIEKAIHCLEIKKHDLEIKIESYEEV